MNETANFTACHMPITTVTTCQYTRGHDDDISLVVGAGPVGLMAAIRLVQAGVKVTYLEAEVSVMRPPRAMVFYPIVTKEFKRSSIFADVRPILLYHE